MGSNIPNPDGLPTIAEQNAAPTVLEPFQKKTVTPLHWLLMQLPLEKLVALIEKLHIKFSIVCAKDSRHANVYRMRIFTPGHVEHAASGRGLHATIANCLTNYLVHTQQDYHELL